MALRTILEFPDQRLRTRAQPVTQFDAELGRLIDDMFETMYAAPGIGLGSLVNLQTPSVVLEKQGPKTLQAGQAARYLIVVRNLGPGAAQQVRIEDELPATGPEGRFLHDFVGGSGPDFVEI